MFLVSNGQSLNCCLSHFCVGVTREIRTLLLGFESSLTQAPANKLLTCGRNVCLCVCIQWEIAADPHPGCVFVFADCCELLERNLEHTGSVLKAILTYYWYINNTIDVVCLVTACDFPFVLNESQLTQLFYIIQKLNLINCTWVWFMHIKEYTNTIVYLL